MKEALEQLVEAARELLQKRAISSMTVLLDSDFKPLLDAYNRALDELIAEDVADEQDRADRAREMREGGIGR